MSRVTVKYYLNKKIKPRKINDTLYYPLYVRVIYNTYNTRFKSLISLPGYDNERGLYLSDSDFELLQNPLERYHLELRKEEKDIVEVVKFIEARFDDYNLTGLKHSLMSYYIVKSEIVSQGMTELAKNALISNGYSQLNSIIRWNIGWIEVFDVLEKVIDKKSELHSLILDMGSLDIELFSIFDIAWDHFINNTNASKSSLMASLQKRHNDFNKLSADVQNLITELIYIRFQIFISHI